jgi:CheY-like chemotaxis protein
MAYEVLLLSSNLSPLAREVVNFFRADVAADIDQVLNLMQQKRYRILVLDQALSGPLDLQLCQTLLQLEKMAQVPLVVLTTVFSVKDKVRALEIGCDDLIDTKTASDEVFARITKSIFNQIANSQLNKRHSATDTSRNGETDYSNRDAVIDFLLKIPNCDNLDQLGQQFFASIQSYGVSCSLQMRSKMGKKDMEVNGMAKHLESQLLYQLKDSGRYVDFGPRTIINHERVSLLIKNMPLHDLAKFNSLKDNFFNMAQGINARISALEDRYQLLLEKEALHKLSSDVRTALGSFKNAYQNLKRQVVAEVETAAEHLDHRVPHLALNEADEQFIYNQTSRLVTSTNRIFNEGLPADELCERLENAVRRCAETAESKSENVLKANNVIDLY